MAQTVNGGPGHVFGLDFGTTNSVIAANFADGPRALPRSGPVPSIVEYHGSTPRVGSAAKQRLADRSTGVIGSVVRSPKRFLGQDEPLHVAGVARDVTDVVADVLSHLRAQAAAEAPERSFDRAVVTIPVTLDGRGRRQLRAAARKAGIEIVQFVHEPLAALYAYLRGQDDHQRRIAELEGRTLLVFDWGGGTLDLTLCRLTNGVLVQLQNAGDAEIGGDEFDERLVRLVRDRHLERHGLSELPDEMEGARQKLIAQCEEAKITLSHRDAASIFVASYLRTDGDAAVLDERVTRDDLENLSRELVDRGMRAIDSVLEAADVSDASVALCLATGGMVGMPYIRQRLLERYGLARVPEVPDAGAMMAVGAAYIAADERRLHLAKPIELLEADGAHLPIVPAGTRLPTLGVVQPYHHTFYCVDPTDGHARLVVTRPVRRERVGTNDPRLPYACLVCAVDPSAWPFAERVELELRIDEDLVAALTVRSTVMEDHRSVEIHDLEFGLGIGAA